MKNLGFAAFLFFVLGSQVGLARDFQNGLSYLDSSYFKKGELPFEKCAIRHDLELSAYSKVISSQAYVEFNKPSLGVGVSLKNIEPLHANYFLTCWVGVNTWAFAIPIHVGALSTHGISLALMGNAVKFDFDELDGKELWLVEGDYQGPMGAIGLLAAGHKRGSLKNVDSGIRLKMRGWYAGLMGVELGRGKIQIGLGKDVTNLVDKTDKDKVKSIPDLMQFKFVKVKWSEIREEEQRLRLEAEEKKRAAEAKKEETKIEGSPDSTTPKIASPVGDLFSPAKIN